MILIYGLFLITICLNSFCLACDSAYNSVFDPFFYLNTNPSLEEHGYHSVEEAEKHWCNHGIDEGRQAIASFHSKQYLERYPDLQEMFGSDYRAATEHYVNIGKAEGRVGFIEGGNNRYTVRSSFLLEDHYVYLSASERQAGAIDSLTWKDKEFINNYDHGRQVQMAMTVQSFGICWNPTEAGGRSDGTGFDTKSILQNIQLGENTLESSVLPGYWIRGDDGNDLRHGKNCEEGAPSYNTEDTHPYPMMKTVTLGCFGLNSCIKFNMTAYMGESSADMPITDGYAQFAAPSTHLTADFTKVSYFDPSTNTRGCVKQEDSEFPIIIHTEDNMFALGLISEPRNETSHGYAGMHYAFKNHTVHNFEQTTFKSVAYIREDYEPGHIFNVMSYLCLGDMEMVIECLAVIDASFK